jgi:hypothetical protein
MEVQKMYYKKHLMHSDQRWNISPQKPGSWYTVLVPVSMAHSNT